ARAGRRRGHGPGTPALRGPVDRDDRGPGRSTGMTTFTDNAERDRYELWDGDQLVGFAEYHFHGDEMAYLHTEIKPEFEGHGYAGRLIQQSLDDARSRGLKVLPYCPFVRGWINKHPDYQDLVPDTHRSMFEL